MAANLITESRGKYVSAVLGMLLGPIIVFGLIILMNRFLGEIDKTPPKATTEMEIIKQEKPDPPKKLKKPKPRPRPQQARVSPPLSGLDSALSGIDMGLLGLGLEGMDVDESLLGKTGASVMTEDAVDTPPRPRNRGNFQYPKAAKQRGIQGHVVLSLLITTDGSVDKVQILESVPAGIFDDAAVAGIRSWRFSPAIYQGAPVKTWVKQKIRFGLE